MQDCSNLLGQVWSILTPTKVVVCFVASLPEMGEQKISSWGSSAQRPHGKGQWGKGGSQPSLWLGPSWWDVREGARGR